MDPVLRSRSILITLAAPLVLCVLSMASGAEARSRLSVKTIAPTELQAVGERTIAWKVSVKGGRAGRVEFEIDGVPTSTDHRAPYVRFVDARSLSVGRHTLKATAFGAGASRQRPSSRVSITVLPRGIYWGAFIEGRNTYGPAFGTVPWDDATWQRFETHAGKKISIVHWGTDLPAWERDFNVFLTMHRKVLSRGVLPLVSMDSGAVPLREIAQGQYDLYLRRWAQQAKAWAHPFFLRWNAEMNGGWNSWGTTSSNVNTPTDFVGAWRRFHDIATAVGADNVTWVWCPNVDSSKALTPFDQLYPGDAYVDWTCLDGYNWGGTQWTRFFSIFSSSYRELLRLAPTKPIMIAEIGSAENGGSKAAWITDMLETQLPARFPRVQAVVWFNWRIFERGRWWDWHIESSLSAQTAFARGISGSHYRQGGGPRRLPLLEKIPPPDERVPRS